VSINFERGECDLCGRNADSIFPLSREVDLMLLDRHFYPKKQIQTSLACWLNFFLRVVLRVERRAGESEQELGFSSLNSKTFETPISLVKSKPMHPNGRAILCGSEYSPDWGLTKAGSSRRQERRTKLLEVVVRFLWTGGVSPNLGL